MKDLPTNGLQGSISLVTGGYLLFGSFVPFMPINLYGYIGETNTPFIGFIPFVCIFWSYHKIKPIAFIVTYLRFVLGAQIKPLGIVCYGTYGDLHPPPRQEHGLDGAFKLGVWTANSFIVQTVFGLCGEIVDCVIDGLLN
jgi:hypothetical protein